ncbi:MAG: YfcE family phosphodiesterase [Desulfuromonadales bacterium]|nr:YfcE family phosphodiesterase [Desulfuromonadales bacterium]
MTRIGVLADTHLNDAKRGVALLDEIYTRYFRDVSLIIHAGDVVNHDIFWAFEGIPVYAVRGNMDPFVQGVPVKRVIEIAGHRIGLIHGWGSPDGLENRILKEFCGQNLDALVYGHSHYPANHVRNGMLFFNPGSVTDKRRAEHCSVGVLEIDEKIHGRIIDID